MIIFSFIFILLGCFLSHPLLLMLLMSGQWISCPLPNMAEVSAVMVTWHPEVKEAKQVPIGPLTLNVGEPKKGNIFKLPVPILFHHQVKHAPLYRMPCDSSHPKSSRTCHRILCLSISSICQYSPPTIQRPSCISADSPSGNSFKMAYYHLRYLGPAQAAVRRDKRNAAMQSLI